ncbi:hypothetical protein, partial [Paenibacillus gorillae]|uniref:hypothetical protein n=1 Tax=Paenibacillus gorillae TaxID=1243662 RepID=UPI0005A8101A
MSGAVRVHADILKILFNVGVAERQKGWNQERQHEPKRAASPCLLNRSLKAVRVHADILKILSNVGVAERQK